MLKQESACIPVSAPETTADPRLSGDWPNPAPDYPEELLALASEYPFIEGVGIEWPTPYEDEAAQAWAEQFPDQITDDIIPFASDTNENLVHLWRIAPHMSTSCAYWRQLKQAEMLMGRLLLLQRENAELRRKVANLERKLKRRDGEQHPIFDVLPELPNLVCEAVERGSDKVRRDTDAEEFVVTVKVAGEVLGSRKDPRLDLDTKVETVVKSKLYTGADKSGAPLDPITGNVIPRSEAYKTTPMGPYLDSDPDGPPDAVIYPDGDHEEAA